MRATEKVTKEWNPLIPLLITFTKEWGFDPETGERIETRWEVSKVEGMDYAKL